MSQYDFGTIDPATKSGSALATDLNSWRTALHSCHKGAAQPSYRIAGIQWIDDSGSPWLLKVYDGTDWITQGSIDAAGNSFIPYRAGVALGTIAALSVGAGLVSDGTNVKVASVLNSRAADYTAVEADRGKFIDFTVAATLNLTAAATLADGWKCFVRNSSGGNVTIDPAAAELVDGVSTVVLAAGESCTLLCTGAAFKTVGRSSGKTAPYELKTGNHTVVAGDLAKSFKGTGSWTLTLTAAATLGAGFWFHIKNAGTGVITIDPNASELIDGLATIKLLPNDGCYVFCDAAGFWSVGFASDAQLQINSQVVSYTLVMSDAGKVVEVSNGSANTLTVPPNSGVAFPIGTKLRVVQTGAGVTTITQGSGVTIRSANSQLAIPAQYAGGFLFKRGTDEWVWLVDPTSTGMTSASAQATTSGTSKTFSNIPAGTKRIIVMFDGVSDTGFDQMLIQLGDAGGIETTGYVFNTVRHQANGNTYGSLTDGFEINTANVPVTGVMTLSLIDSATNTWMCESHLFNSGPNGMVWGIGTKSLSAVLTQLRLFIDGNDTFDAGKVNILYQ